MLEFIRTHKKLFSVLFVVAGSALILSMFSNPYTGAAVGHGGGTVVARVDGADITLGELAGEVRRRRTMAEERIEEQIATSGNKAETRKFLEQYFRSQWSPDRTLEDLIDRKFRIASSQNMGIEVPGELIKDSLHQTPVFQKDGKFDSLQYKEILKANNFTPGRYEDMIREDARLSGLINAVRNSLSIISPEEVKVESQLKKRLNLELLTLSPSKFADASKPSPAEIKALADDSTQAVKLQSYYDRNISKYKKPEEVHARHILIKDEEGGLAKATEILSDIKANKITFEEAAKKYSADKSNSERGGDLGFFPRGMMDPAFEKASFDLKSDNELASSPVKSSFGYHLIQRLGYRAAETKKLEDVKSEIAENVLIETKRSEKLRSFSKTIVESGKSPSDAELKKLGLSWSPTSWSALDSALGPIQFVDDYRGKLMQLSASNPVLKELIPQGEDLVVVRWAAPKKDAKEGDQAKDITPTRLALEKVVGGFEFAQNRVREELVKSKKIYRNSDALAQLRASLGESDSAPLGR